MCCKVLVRPDITCPPEQTHKHTNKDGTPMFSGSGRTFRFLLLFASCGSVYLATSPLIAFPVYFTELVEVLDLPASQVSWLGAMQAAFMFITSVLTGVLVQRYGCRIVARSGSVITFLALAASSFHSNIYAMYVTYGMCTGIGMSMSLLPSTIIVQQHFRKRRALASGISYCGINLCFLTVGPAVRFLLDTFGWHGVVLLHGAAMLHIQIFAFAFKPPNKPTPKTSPANATSADDAKGIECKELDVVLIENKDKQECSTNPTMSDENSSQEFEIECLPKPRRQRTISQNCAACEDSIDIVKHSLEYTHSHAHMLDDYEKTREQSAAHLGDTNCDGCNATSQTNSSDPLLSSEHLLNSKPVETVINISEPTPSNGTTNRTTKPKVPPQKGLHGILKQILGMFDRSIFQETNFVLIMIAGACIQASLMSFHQHFVRRAILSGVSKHYAAFLPTCIGIASMISRITFGYIGSFPQVNRVILYAVGTASCGTVVILSGLGYNFTTFVIVAACNGLTSGLLAPLQQTILVDILGVPRLPQAQGCTALFSGFATLLATPFAGYLVEHTDNYNIPFYVMGTVTIIGASLIAMIAIRNQQTKCCLPNDNEDA